MATSIDKVVQAAQQGDRGAQHQIYETFHKCVYHLMVRMVGMQDAADLAQQAFLQAFRRVLEKLNSLPLLSVLVAASAPPLGVLKREN